MKSRTFAGNFRTDILGAGKLYVVATPIGNLADISKRAADVLKSVSFIMAEDTRNTAGLLSAVSAGTKMVSYHKFNEKERTGNVIQRILSGEDAAIVSDAGTPVISDPGHIVVKACADNGIEVVSVPGPSSVTAALSISGFDCSRFAFMGFIPKKEKEAKEEISRAGMFDYPSAWFESPERIEKSVKLISELLPERQICVVKEITKIHEAVFRGTAADILSSLTPDRQRGEFVVIIGGASGETQGPEDSVIIEKLKEYTDLGEPRSSAIKKTADSLKCPKNRVYRLAHNGKQEE